MDDATPAPRTCPICGGPVRADNTIGICTSRANPECFRAYARERYKRSRDDAPSAELKHCETCGKELLPNNQTGVCSGNIGRECQRVRNRRRKRLSRALPVSSREACEVCGGKLRIDNIVGICKRTPECRRELQSRRRQQARETTARERGPRVPAERPRRVPVIPAGTTFNRWVTLEDSPKGGLKILCRCECGESPERYVYISNLKRGLTLSCGCHKREAVSRPRSPGGIYLPAGSVSGRLTTLEAAGKCHDEVLVRCACGRETRKKAQPVKLGVVLSCGVCLKPGQTHGLSGHPLYRIWYGIVGRGSRPGSRDYENYGAMGRTVCEGWRAMSAGLLSFAADMGPRPAGYSTERIDNDGGYWCGHCEECVRLGRPANCRWATRKEQNNNRWTATGMARQRNAALAGVTRQRAPRNRKPADPPDQGALF